ncbi:NitT/TauT family transport system permease protein/sulfonate transport system permease protein [Faunimonas pinastri]|uniref:NitT/TauT family transport system permease protein/sulfonate transport system permease protein n=1 Tax=Faunimonas pinastri TaxID=1855383 RepID=A0A1H9B790_9HYPH|nr:ABC transporter permease subunit [Faunimonas pinastri]SEP84553.1 NitT/TauT family transport system permease protein/sulfonate transport system permease protein [Faunimonas pinastri]
MQLGRLTTNILGIVLVLILWQAVGMHLGDALVATPVQVAKALPETLTDPEFWPALGLMIGQMMIGYLLALAVGIPLGIAMGRSRPVFTVVKPWASMFIVVSAAALVPLLIILMGRGLLFRTCIVFVATLWYVVVSITEAARAVSPRLLDVAKSFSASDFQRFRFVILPALYPYLLIAARIGLIHALRAMVTAEMFIGAGFGGLLNNAGLDLSTAPLFGLIVVLMLVSAGATELLRRVAGRAAPWYASRTGG